MNSADNRMPMSTVAIIAAAFAVVFLILFMWVGGFGFWGALLLGLLVGVAVFVVLMFMFAGDGAVGAGPAAGATGSETGAAIARESAKPAAAAGGGAAVKPDEAAKPASPAKPKPKPKAAEPVAKPKAKVKPKSAPAAKVAAKKAPAKTAKAVKPAKASKPAKAPKPEVPATLEVVAAGSGVKPEALAAAREGGADNLKEIKGVGPKMEVMLNEMGFFHFDQIAGWSEAEVAWVDQNLKGFKGRVSRDDWVAQAKILAAGGETEFSNKVDKGGVY